MRWPQKNPAQPMQSRIQSFRRLVHAGDRPGKPGSHGTDERNTICRASDCGGRGAPVAGARRACAPGGAVRRGRAAAPGGLGTVPALRGASSRAGRPWFRRLHVRPAPRLRRGPYRRHRRHRALPAAKGAKTARRRLLLLARTCHGRAMPGSCDRARGKHHQAAFAGAQGHRRDSRSRGFRNFPVDHRHPEPAGAGGHPRGLENGPRGQP